DKLVTGVQTCALPILDGRIVPGRHGRSGLIPARRDIGMRSREDRQRLAVAVEIGELRVGAREMALEIENAVAALQEERDLAGDEIGRASCRERGGSAV